jgi:hypothetical protein
MAAHTTVATDLRHLTIGELRTRAQTRERGVTRWGVNEDEAGLELFRRAITECDDQAWQAVMDVYRDVLVVQMRRRALRGLISEDDGFCVDRAFQRFWHATTHRHAERRQSFDDLASILKYLKLCLGSVLLDEARLRRRQACASLDEAPVEAQVCPDSTSGVIAGLARRDLWEAVARELPDANERLVARLSFVAALTPREILGRHPEKFADVVDVYRTKRNMIERLRRSQAIRDILL